MNRILLFILVITCNLNALSQPDYSKIRFYSKIKEYKEIKPSLKGIDVKKSDVNQIITLLGDSFYTEAEIVDMTEKIWLSFINPKQFDYVFKDLAIRSIPNWNKKNYKGEIVIEPNPLLALWTIADNEKTYFQSALGQLLTYYGLMGYGENGKETKKSINKMLYTKTTKFRPVRSSDYTASYLKHVNAIINPKNLSVLVTTKYYFIISKTDRKEEVSSLLKKIDWHFSMPQ